MFENVWKPKEKLILTVLSTLWLFSVGLFWLWWFDPLHVGTKLGFLLTSFVLAWSIILPGYCLAFLLRMKRPNRSLPLSADLKVAVVVTKAPSEPLSLVQKTLRGVLDLKVQHHTWVADEDPSPEALEWYRKHGIRVSCRKDHPDYHNDSWPRRKKCKEGNLAYFYDHFGYKDYDIVVQMDADHVPKPDYLEHMLRPFSDEKVGYVAAPSVCDNNCHESWSARARAHSESMFHGPIQSGANAGWVPICIGSHYAVRTKALRQIGGLGPELAEDYSTTLLMNACGWKGIWAFDAEAHGDGPNNFSDLVVQDYQWSRSLVTLLLSFYPKHLLKLSLKQILQFSFTQLWYPLSAISWFISILLPIVALLTGVSPVRTNFIEFIYFISLPLILSLVIYFYARGKGHLRPRDVKLFSWENALFELARWPWVLIACIDAIFAVILRKKLTYKVTPKGEDKNAGVLPMKIHTPYVVIICAILLVINFGQDNSNLRGYFLFAVATALSYLFLIVSSLYFHKKEARLEIFYFVRCHMPQLLLSGIFGVWMGYSLLSDTLHNYPSQKIELVSVSADSLDVKTKTSSFIAFEKPAFEVDSGSNVQEISHIVKPGESLWRISRKYYGKGEDWKLIKTSSGSKIIQPGELLRVPILNSNKI